MNENLYLVSYTRHNALTDGWAYKVEAASTNLDEAKKKYHALLAEFIGGDTFDFVSVMLYDKFNNPIMDEYWTKTESIATEV